MEPMKMLDQNAAVLASHLSHTLKAGEDEMVKEKVHRMWSMLSTAVHGSIEKIKRSDWKPRELEHGLRHVQRVKLMRDVHHVMFNVVTQEFICMLSSTDICIYHCDGRKIRELSLAEPLEGLLYSHKVHQYVGWNHCPQLKVLSPDFRTLSVNQARHSITCCCYDRELNQIVTAGIGNVCSWRFYFGCRDLICNVAITQGLAETDTFTDLVVEVCPVSMLPAAHVQCCYAVCKTGVASFDLTKGILLTYEKHLHERKITGIAIVETLRCVATSSRDGSIKVWDQSWNLKMIFIGHRGPVTALAIYPDGPCLLSASKDGTLRVWNVDTVDQVDEVQVGVTVTRLGTEPGQDHIFSCAQQRLDFWTITRLHIRHTAIGYDVSSIHVTNIALAGHFPVRAACSCGDGTARLISPEAGDVISTLLLEPGRQVVALDYCLPREALVALTDQGDLLKGNSLSNPMEVLMKVPHGRQASTVHCLCIYAHVDQVSAVHSRWQQVVTGGSEEKIQQFGVKDSDRYLVITGHEDGRLSVLDWSSGTAQYTVQAHHSARVLTLVPDPSNQRLFSSGLDKAVKVWRVFPFARDSLTPLMSFFAAHTPTHLCLLKSAFIMALQNTVSAVHSIVLYDVRKRLRRDHHPDHDHKDEITGLSSCPDLKIFASICRGGALNIWDHKNQLIRIVHLKAVANSISFCNSRGDLLLGIEKNLHRMSSDEYLTQSYLLQVACQDFIDPLLDNPVPISKTAAESLSPADLRRLGQAHSFKHSQERPQISEEEPDEETKRKQEELKEAYAVLAAREQEILLIQRGELKSKKNTSHSKKVLQEGFQRYMQLIYGETPRIEIPELVMDEPAEQRLERPYKCLNIRKGFFPTLAVPRPWDEVTEGEKEARGLPFWAGPPDVPIALDGFIPNSVFLRLLWPMEPWQDLDDSEIELRVEVKEVVKTELELEQTPDSKVLLKLETPVSWEPESSDLGRSRVFSTTPEPVMETKPPKQEEKLQITSDAPAPQFQNNKKKEKSPEQKFGHPEWHGITPPLKPKVEKLPTPVSRPSPAQRRSPPQEPEVSTSPPLPMPVQRFKGEAWFNKAFPNADSKTFSPDLTDEGFVLMLINLLWTAEYKVKEEVTNVLAMLLPSQPAAVSRLTHETLMAILSGPNPPQAEIREQREFIRAALGALKQLVTHSQEFFVELMVQFLQSDVILRATVKAILDELGLQDPHNYLDMELSSWEDRDHLGTQNRQELRKVSQAWLRHWMQQFKEHIQGAARSLNAGNTLRAALPISSSAVPDRHGQSSVGRRQRKASALRLQARQTLGSLDSLHPIEAVNYFCELQLEQKLQELRVSEQRLEEGQDVRNAVLFLPKITRDRPIMRLGETREAAPTQKRQLPHLPLRPLTFALGRVIRLPVSEVSLNPFPSALDRLPPHSLLTLRQSGQKYFILEHSLVSSYC
ncbi:WD repeat-containing protein 97-like isoform X2 [Hemitrygon akajei]|uniref:WD repeat-containing protein 97-like isoform X2 n=1 Tax=Hemitrygon akajei TaxID=2704970 RepID=UPI003BFA10DC